eukprot:SAG25_NODE_339_length_9497_cov_2.975109_11_plen_87_part_00
MTADGGDAQAPTAFAKFLGRLQTCIDGEMAFTLVLRDPTGNSYVQALDESDEVRARRRRLKKHSLSRERATCTLLLQLQQRESIHN